MGRSASWSAAVMRRSRVPVHSAALRGVLRDVTGDLGICQLPGSRDRTGVVFAAPDQGPGGYSRSDGRDDGDGADRLVDGGGEQAEGGPGGRCSGWSGGAVEADDGVEVDDPAPLVFSDLGIRDPYLRGKRLVGDPSLAGKGPTHG